MAHTIFALTKLIGIVLGFAAAGAVGYFVLPDLTLNQGIMLLAAAFAFFGIGFLFGMDE